MRLRISLNTLLHAYSNLFYFAAHTKKATIHANRICRFTYMLTFLLNVWGEKI